MKKDIATNQVTIKEFLTPDGLSVKSITPDSVANELNTMAGSHYTIEEPAERGFEDLGYSSSQAEQLKKMISANADVVVISGKTNTEHLDQ